ncbi:MAG TPA: hypothetical protein ENH41_03665 [Candidatus Omnitrophica bacterium]|nr:hypothetical protein [Candidatus Omnitrophota bacterium]
MDQDEVCNLKEKISPFITNEGFDLVEVKLLTFGRRKVLSVLADRSNGGITIGECAALNRKISNLFEKEPNLLEDDYLVEVSSPGLDRPLATKNDFLKTINSNLNILLNSTMKAAQGKKEKQEFDGELIEVRDENIHLNTKEGILIISLDNIKKAKQIIG